jgi:NAD(P)-dependent dehydrogenase (short-subunit alcohol dehydrogenase family)
MSEYFSIKLQTISNYRTFFHSQLLRSPAKPEQSFADQVIIVTGSNVGLGFEAARHFYRLNCAKLILAVRTVAKGEIAKEDIAQSVKHRTDSISAIEIWPLDLSDTASTIAFAKRVTEELPRLDVLVENAGIVSSTWEMAEGFEQTIQVNVLNTFLLALSVLPKLRGSKSNFPDASPHLVVVSSEAHHMTKFLEINAPDLYEKLHDGKERYEGMER